MKKPITILMLTAVFYLSFNISARDIKMPNLPEIITEPNPELLSEKYRINLEELTIKDVPYGESLSDFLQNISANQGIKLEVMKEDGITTASDLQSGYKLKLSQEEGGEIIRVYTIFMDDLPGMLFFSEYIEGSSNNKALEIYNPSESPVKLKYFRIVQSTNGGGWKNFHTFQDKQIIASKATWVIINNKTNPSLFDFTKANEIESTSGVVGFNGNDARGLIKILGTDTSLMDVIGIHDQDPGSGWDVAGVKNATMNKTIIRKPGITTGNNNWSISAGSDQENSEWIVMSTDYFTDLGLHSTDPGIISSMNIKNDYSRVRIYPIPAENNITLENPYGKCIISLKDITGRTLLSINSEEKNLNFDISDLKEGVYLLLLNYPDKQLSLKFIKQ